MKLLVVTMACGERSREYATITFPAIQAYALRCGADFLSITNEAPGYDYFGYQKLEYVKLLNSYDRILHIDADIVVKRTAPDLFKLVPANHFAGVNEYPYQNLPRERPAIDRYGDMKKLGDIDPKFYINAGMYLFSAAHSHIFGPMLDPHPCHYMEQTQLNFNLHKEANITLLPPQFNFMSMMEWSGLNKKDAHFIHYAGSWGGKTKDWIMAEMRKDLK